MTGRHFEFLVPEAHRLGEMADSTEEAGRVIRRGFPRV